MSEFGWWGDSIVLPYIESTPSAPISASYLRCSQVRCGSNSLVHRWVASWHGQPVDPKLTGFHSFPTYLLVSLSLHLQNLLLDQSGEPANKLNSFRKISKFQNSVWIRVSTNGQHSFKLKALLPLYVMHVKIASTRITAFLLYPSLWRFMQWKAQVYYDFGHFFWDPKIPQKVILGGFLFSLGSNNCTIWHRSTSRKEWGLDADMGYLFDMYSPAFKIWWFLKF